MLEIKKTSCNFLHTLKAYVISLFEELVVMLKVLELTSLYLDFTWHGVNFLVNFKGDNGNLLIFNFVSLS